MNISIVGTGTMGFPMVERLLAGGHNVSVWNRTPEKAAPLVALGAHRVDRPDDAARVADVVISIVTDPAAVEAVTLGPTGILEGIGPETVHCDMSTVTPESADRMAQTYRDRGRRFVQAPVLGSKRQIADGTLLVFAGGTDENIDRCAPAWNAFARRNWRFPTAGQASTVKLACNMTIAQMILALGQALVCARKGVVESETFLEILGESALACPMYASKGRTIVERNFAANFFVKHMLKDLALAEEAGVASGTPLPMNALAKELFEDADRRGYGDDDYSAVVRVLEDLAGL